MTDAIVIADYGMGNLRSIYGRLRKLGIDSAISSDPGEIGKAGKIILPGVGHFAAAMSNLRARGLVDVLTEAAQDDRKKILGICLGMQLMLEFSEEGNCAGLGWVEGKVLRMNVPDHLRYKVPHMGWNVAASQKPSPLMEGVNAKAEFYFVHSYYCSLVNSDDVLAVCTYGSQFACALECGNLFGVQFHPEKSHESGGRLLCNFAKL